MKKQKTRSYSGLLILAVVLTGAGVFGSSPAQAQDVPPQQGRQIRGYVPPDQLVSFRPETPFTQFIDFLNPIFERINGKQAIDPESRQFPIGIAISGAQYFDAFELVLNYNGLIYRETDRFFIIEEAPPEPNLTVQQPGAGLAETPAVPATLDTREIQISAVLFSINKTKARDLGTDWNVFFGGETSAGGNQGGGATSASDVAGGGVQGGGTTTNTIPKFFLKSDDLADAVDDFLLMPDQFDVATLTQLFRFLETSGAGETVANPSITVQSGELGRIQIGTDFPFIVRDFSGNSITQFVSTGIIIEVTPTLLTEAVADTAGSPLIDFIHMNIQVENSNGAISAAGPVVDRSLANTQVLLLDGEQTVIGGLYSNEESVSRRGIPFLKDLPGWFFGIKYLVSVTQKQNIQRELVILLRAKLVDPVLSRSKRPFDQNLLERWRRKVEQDIESLSPECDPTFQEECKKKGTRR